MKTYKVTAQLSEIVKTGVSYFGNPHATIVVRLSDGTEIIGKTCVNGAIGYCYKNGGIGANAKFKNWTYHTTRTGNVIFDYCE